MILFILMLIVARLAYLAGGQMVAKIAKDAHLAGHHHTGKYRHQKTVTTW